ncbi:MAG: pyridoxamine 5'-phosphate oxidase [Polyangiaceae bacterium]
MKTDLSEMRRDYDRGRLDESMLDEDPIVELQKWMQIATDAKVIEPNAMTLATASRLGIPNARIVLAKSIDASGVVFYTNYDSHKGHELDANPHAALDFYWKEIARQVRIQGEVEHTGPSQSDAYFKSRPRESQLGAWVSEHQSEPITRAELDARHAELEKKYSGKEIPRPPFWGGYCVTPARFEFWLGGPGRLHDCVAYVRDGGTWKRLRVSP